MPGPRCEPATLPESERTTSLSTRGSLLSISSSSSSSPSLPSGLQPSAAHSSCSFASVSPASGEPQRLREASQSLRARFCREGRRCTTNTRLKTLQSYPELYFGTDLSAPVAWPAQTSGHNVRHCRSCCLYPPRNSGSPPELLRCSAKCCTPDADTGDYRTCRSRVADQDALLPACRQ